jgi:hypothetical protein
MLSLEGSALSQRKRKRSSPTTPVTTSTANPSTVTSSKNLTRPRAAELIKTHPSFIGTTDSDIPVGTFWFDRRDIQAFVESNIQPLVDKGLVTFRKTGRSNAVWFHECVVEITSEGESVAKDWKKGTNREWVLKYQGPVGIASPDVTLYHIAVAERRLIEVTGIATDSNGTRARVEFTWKWVPTTYGKYIVKAVPSEESHGGAVECQLYDDGWRMGQMYIGFPFFN